MASVLGSPGTLKVAPGVVQQMRNTKLILRAQLDGCGTDADDDEDE